MNEEIREAEEVLMLIKKATMFADPIMKIGTIGKELFEKYYSISEKEKLATQAAQQRMEKAIGKTVVKNQIKAPTPPIKAK